MTESQPKNKHVQEGMQGTCDLCMIGYRCGEIVTGLRILESLGVCSKKITPIKNRLEDLGYKYPDATNFCKLSASKEDLLAIESEIRSLVEEQYKSAPQATNNAV